MNLIRKIMVLLSLLVGLFVLGMWVMSELNVRYSREAMSNLRLKQIEEAFYSNLDRINAYNQLMEKHVESLATLGELFYNLRERYDTEFKTALAQALFKHTENFPEVFGGGIWYEPTTLTTERYFAPYAYWDKNRVNLSWDYSTAAYNYLEQGWYQTILPPDWDRKTPRPDRFYWLPARYVSLLDSVVITLGVIMYSARGDIIGIATTDWGIEEIISIVSESDLTANSFSFLIDEKDRKLGLSRESSVASQNFLASLSMATFADQLTVDSTHVLTGYQRRMLTHEMTFEGRVYELFFSQTRAGMIFGISVPKDEIYQVIESMRVANYQILTITIFILLVLAAGILYSVVGTMKLLDTLYTDNLTGLPTRTCLLPDLRNLREGVIILLNIDAFKEVNDFYGHQCGDTILKELAKRLQHFVQEHHGLLDNKLRLHKMSADEFALLITHTPDMQHLNQFLKQLTEFVSEQTFFCEDQELTLGMTLGVALNASIYELSARRGEIFLSSANMALEMARQQKKRCLIYDESMKIREEYASNLFWAKKLKKALVEDRLVPYFQPIINNKTGAVEKFECLVRMIDEDQQIISPAKFLPIAHKLCLHHDITCLMIEKSFDVFTGTSYDFSLNLSYDDIINPQTQRLITEKLKNNPLAKQVLFEILESESIENYQQVLEFIQIVKDQGGRIAIDDFGTGYSNFEHLLRLNVDVIKIDGSLIRNLDQDKNAFIVTQGIVQFAHKLNLKTVAEFVHAEAIQARVLEIGIDYSQGFYLGAPQADLTLNN